MSGKTDERRGAFEGIVEGSEKGSGRWEDSGRMLQPTGDRPEPLERHSLFLEDSFDFL
jgi:hypothetical protein